jgi:hypothetical protein
MTDAKKLSIVLVVAVSLRLCVGSQPATAQANPTVGGSGSNTSYPGRWDLTIKTPTQERASWIELSENKGRLEGLLIGLW